MFYLALLASQASSLDRDLGCGNVSGRGATADRAGLVADHGPDR